MKFVSCPVCGASRIELEESTCCACLLHEAHLALSHLDSGVAEGLIGGLDAVMASGSLDLYRGYVAMLRALSMETQRFQSLTAARKKGGDE